MGWSRFGEIVFMTFFFWIAMTGLFWVVTLPLSGWPEGIASVQRSGRVPP